MILFVAVGCFMAYPEAVTAKHTGITRHYTFNIKLKNITRLCHTKSIVTLRSGWADGPSYITQCPIQTGHYYVYNFTITGQRGTLFWHAHISRLRATVYRPLIILPRRNKSYPFVKPYKEVPILITDIFFMQCSKYMMSFDGNLTQSLLTIGEWFNADPEAVINQSLQTGGGPNVSDAYTFNGLPGPLYNCSAKDIYKLKVKPGKTYLLRLINAALNDKLFFIIADHSLTVVEADTVYVKPFETNVLMITPGKTTNVLLKTKSKAPNATFLMLVRPYATGMGTFDNTTVAGILEYETPSSSLKNRPLLKPGLPAINATNFVANFTSKFRSLATAKFPANVPQKVDKKFFFTVGLGTKPCPKNQTYQGSTNTIKFAASMNNISFALPRTALLQSHFFSRYSKGVYTTDFPAFLLIPFNYTGTPPNNTLVKNGTKLMVIPFNTSVEDTSILGTENHPLYLHGYNFYVVGQGFGNFDPENDPSKFNLVDYVERNTVGVPSSGWVAVRFQAENPGVWLMHCHFDVHQSWGLGMAWIVLDGEFPNQKLPPPPSDLPTC
ncbi:hypothetical protein CXB51_009124 [Gossypium anomalum]|uniref:Laccase n=1 Tax=Gossypium anomalum TaxID=47600 RepID=A0A8J5YYX4_9ROSI|nr:hypothetical protein CXB51_009124 [Gossypium anomalum]